MTIYVCVFYIGFPEQTMLSAFIELISLYLTGKTKMPKLVLILMFFMKLRLNLFDQDIAHRFGVHSTTVSRNFHRILNIAETK